VAAIVNASGSHSAYMWSKLKESQGKMVSTATQGRWRESRPGAPWWLGLPILGGVTQIALAAWAVVAIWGHPMQMENIRDIPIILLALEGLSLGRGTKQPGDPDGRRPTPSRFAKTLTESVWTTN